MRRAMAAGAVLTMVVLAGCSGGDGEGAARSAAGGSSDTSSAQARTPSGGATTSKAPGATKSSRTTDNASAGATATARGKNGQSAAKGSNGTGGKTAKSGAKGSSGTGGTKGQAAPKGGGSRVGVPGVKVPGTKPSPNASGGSSGNGGAPGAGSGSGGSPSASNAEVALTDDGKDEAAQRYLAIDAAFDATTADLSKALSKSPLDMAAVRAAITKASAGYDKRTDALRAMHWPASIKPAADKYIDLAATAGHRLMTEAEQATSLEDLTKQADDPDFQKLADAEAKVRSLLGLPPA
jgi:hypothetical protein